MLIQMYPDPKECPCIEDAVASVGAYFGVLLGGWALNHLSLTKVWDLKNNLLLKILVGKSFSIPPSSKSLSIIHFSYSFM